MSRTHRRSKGSRIAHGQHVDLLSCLDGSFAFQLLQQPVRSVVADEDVPRDILRPDELGGLHYLLSRLARVVSLRGPRRNGLQPVHGLSQIDGGWAAAQQIVGLVIEPATERLLGRQCARACARVRLVIENVEQFARNCHCG